MLKQNIPQQLLTEALVKESIIKDTLDNLGMHLYSTLTWGAAIGAFIGPAKATLANQAAQVTPENYVLLATALAAATFHKMVSKEHQQEINDKLEERGLVGAFEKADDEVGTIRKVIAWLANAMGKGIDEILGIASFTVFFTPIVEYIVSTTGVIDIPDPMAALKLIMTSVGIEAFRSFVKYAMAKDRETTQTLKNIDATLARAKEKQVDVDIKDLREMIEEIGKKRTLSESIDEEQPPCDDCRGHDIHYGEEKEGKMARRQLFNLMNNSKYLHDLIGDDTDLPEWVEVKITKATDYLTAAKQYLDYNMQLTGDMYEIDQTQRMTKEETLDMVKALANRTACPQTKQLLSQVVEKLE